VRIKGWTTDARLRLRSSIRPAGRASDGDRDLPDRTSSVGDCSVRIQGLPLLSGTLIHKLHWARLFVRRDLPPPGTRLDRPGCVGSVRGAAVSLVLAAPSVASVAGPGPRFTVDVSHSRREPVHRRHDYENGRALPGRALRCDSDARRACASGSPLRSLTRPAHRPTPPSVVSLRPRAPPHEPPDAG